MLASQLRLISRIALVVMIPLVTFFTTQGTYNFPKRDFSGGWSGHFYMAQADAMLNGRLDVYPPELQGECYFREGRCYGYFGITPSVLRLPLYAKGRWFRSSLTPLYIGLALVLAFWAALNLLRQSLLQFADPAQPRALVLGYAVAGALALGPGGTLMFLTRPGIYEEAVAWSVAFALLTLDRVWAWQRTGKRLPLFLAVVFGIAAANARPSAAMACGVLGLAVAALCWLGNRAPFGGKRFVYIAAVCLSLLPALTASGVYWLKLGTLMPDLRQNEQFRAAPWWIDILHKNGDRTGGVMFLPTELVAYFRPDAVIAKAEWPFFDFRFPRPQPILWVPPLPKGGAYVEPFTSVTASMPLPWALNLVVAIWLGVAAWRLALHRSPTSPRLPLLTREQWILAAGSLAAAAAMAVLVLTTVGITNRYLGDFFAISVVGVALGHRVLLPLLVRRPKLSAPLGLVALLLVSWSVLVTLSLSTRLVFG